MVREITISPVKAVFAEVLHKNAQKYWQDFYNGRIKRPCDDECPAGCDGNHYYKINTTFAKLFEAIK